MEIQPILHHAPARSSTVDSNNVEVKRKPHVLAAGHSIPGSLQLTAHRLSYVLSNKGYNCTFQHSVMLLAST